MNENNSQNSTASLLEEDKEALVINEDLFITQCNMGDKHRYVELMQSGEVQKTLLLVPYPYSVEDAEWFINFARQKHIERGCFWNFAIRSRAENGQVIGGMTVNPLENEPGAAELGYWLAQSHWGRGLMPIILKFVVGYVQTQKRTGLAYTDIDRLVARVFSYNAKSARVLQKCGFEFVQRYPNYYEKNGVPIDSDHYQLKL